MPRTTITPQVSLRTSNGLTPTYSAADQANGQQFQNTGRELIHVKNTNGATRTLTVPTPGSVDGLAVADAAFIIPATTGDKFIGPFPPAVYNQADGYLYMDWSADTNVTVAVIRLP